jgi:hypothetical protein
VTVTIKALRTVITDGAKQYPIYLGYLPATELASVSEVPSFSGASSNADIARNVLNPPIKDWQRPLIELKWKSIRDKFSRTGELMPNPVLLAVADGSHVRVAQQNLHGQLTEIFEIEVDDPGQNAEKPLWILDGQHRVKGVSESTHNQNPIPLVLLYGEAANAYSPAQFARVFAEVTTYATPLDPLHEDWLRFAFQLGNYEAGAGGVETATFKAMAATALLCELQNVGPNRDANPFHDKIQFNPERPASAAIGGGFVYNSLMLKELILQSYYNQPSATLGPKALAEQLALAVLALVRNDSTPTHSSAFFGDAAHRQRYLQDAFLIGACNYLRVRGTPSSWDTVLQDLTFNATSWDVTPWVVTTGGNTGNVSKTVANNVFGYVFGEGALPSNVSTLPTFLSGDNAEITLRASFLTPTGRAKSINSAESKYPVNGNKAFNVEGRRHIRLTGSSLNIGKLDVIDLGAPLDNRYTASRLRRGIVLAEGGGTVRLLIRAEYYGGTQTELRVSVTWT